MAALFTLLMFFAALVANASPAASPHDTRQLTGLLLNMHISGVNAHFTGASLLNNQIRRVDFNISPILPGLSLITSVALNSVSLSATSGTTAIFTAEKTFDPPIVVPLDGSVNSGVINNVPLTQGSVATLGVVGSGTLNANAAFDTHVTIITEPLVLPLPVTTLDLGVPTKWSITLLDD